jgi:hypothetical protein
MAMKIAPSHASPKGWDRSQFRLQQEFATAETGFNDHLRCKNLEPPVVKSEHFPNV